MQVSGCCCWMLQDPHPRHFVTPGSANRNKTQPIFCYASKKINHFHRANQPNTHKLYSEQRVIGLPLFWYKIFRLGTGAPGTDWKILINAQSSNCQNDKFQVDTTHALFTLSSLPGLQSLVFCDNNESFSREIFQHCSRLRLQVLFSEAEIMIY